MTGLIVILIPLLIYIVGALSVARKDLTHPDDFFVAFKKVGVTAFSSSSIAYAFQVSTIYPFLLWGASGSYFVPAVNTICWGLGIFIFYLCYNKYKQYIGKDLTLHGFLGETYGSSIRVVASYLTIIAFLGCAIAETYFGSKVLLSIVDNKNVFYLIVAVALLFVYGYIAYGGQVSSIRTDQLQLIISYVGVFGLMLYFIYLIISNGINISPILSWSFLTLFLFIIAVFYFRKLKFIKFSEQDSNSDKYLNKFLNFLVIAVFGLVAIFSLVAFTSAKTTLAETKFFNIKGFGIPGLLSLIILPLSFQFIDLSNWQRLLSVKPDTTSESESLNKNIRKGLLTYAIESPFTWVIFIFFGLLTITSLPQFTFQDLLIDIPKQLIHSNNHLQEILGYTFIVSVLAIMLSTVDSFIMGIIFTFVYDSYPKTRKLLDSKNTNEIEKGYSNITNTGRIFGLIAIICGVIIFVILDIKVPNGGELFINLLLAFYAAQLAFFPHVFGILFLKNHPSKFWANASMIIGALCGVGVGFYAVLAKHEWAWYPILICFGLSTFIYVIGYILKRNNFDTGIKKFYSENKFYSILMLIAILSITIFSYYFLSVENNFQKGVRVWEIASYVITLIYTIWFWYVSKNGRTILKDISSNNILTVILITGPAIGGLSLITTFHLILILGGNALCGFFTYNSVNITLGLIVAVYMIFYYINKRVIKHCKNEKLKQEFTLSFKYIDKPSLFIFCILLTYSLYVNRTGNLHSMEIFFSGAITFELLLSSIVWAQTDVA